MKDFLIFTGVGEDTQFLSWAKKPNPYFDRGINIYKETDKNSSLMKEINPEIILYQPGEIWNVLVNNYHLFKKYKYILIIDSDLVISPIDIQTTFLKAKRNNWTGCQWSRNPNTFCGNPKRVQKWFTKKSGIRETNFIEMIFMLVRQDLLSLTVEKWKEFNLTYSFGCDIVLANTAQKNNMLPFYILDDFEFYNPHPHEKKNKERVIDKELKSTVKERGTNFKKNAISKDTAFFQISWKNAYVK
jgi:hypothetical protein